MAGREPVRKSGIIVLLQSYYIDRLQLEKTAKAHKAKRGRNIMFLPSVFFLRFFRG
jgi:hypothetical protein